MRVTEIVSRWHDKEDLGPFSIDGGIYLYAGDIFEVIGGEIDAVFEAVRLNAQMVSGTEAVGGGSGYPVDSDTDQIQKFPTDNGNLGGIDTVGAENRAAAAFGALIKVVEPFFQDRHGQFTSAGHLPENFSGRGEVFAINGTEQFGAEDRHIFGVAGADIEMTFVGAGAASDTDIHEDPQRAEFVNSFAEPLEDDFFPIGRQLPIVFGRLPFARKRKPQILHALGVSAVVESPSAEFNMGVHPVPAGGLVVY